MIGAVIGGWVRPQAGKRKYILPHMGPVRRGCSRFTFLTLRFLFPWFYGPTKYKHTLDHSQHAGPLRIFYINFSTSGHPTIHLADIDCGHDSRGAILNELALGLQH